MGMEDAPVSAHSKMNPDIAGMVPKAREMIYNQGNYDPVGRKSILGETDEERFQREANIRSMLGYRPGFSDLENKSRTALSRTLDPGYMDIYSRPEFQKYASGVQRAGRESFENQADSIRAMFSQGGQSFSSPLLSSISNLGERTSLGVSDQIGRTALPFLQDATEAPFRAAPYAMQYGGLEREFPLTQMEMGQKAYGLQDIPRQFGQLRADEEYNYQTRAREARLQPLRDLMALITGTPLSQENIQGKTTTDKIKSIGETATTWTDFLGKIKKLGGGV